MGQGISKDDQLMIEEGSAKIYFSKEDKMGEVFYNPVQHFNRDLTCSIIQTFQKELGKEISIFEAFAATGLRSLRYAKEVKGVKSVIANDLDPHAVSIINKNIIINKVTGIVKSSVGDANDVMNKNPLQFSVIDLDPYSTAAIFLHAAIQSIEDGGLLCITSTDGRSLCGTQPDTAYSWYNTMPLNTEFAHEFGIRTLLTTIMTIAARYRRSVEPLLSMRVDFYFRVFVRIHDKPIDVKPNSANTSLCFYSIDTGSFWLQPMGTYTRKGSNGVAKPTELHIPYTKDPYTNGPLKIGGPVYSGPLHSKAFIQKIIDVLPQMSYLQTLPRIMAVLNTCMSEIDAPFYYDIGALCGIVKSSCPPRAMIVSAIEKLGFQCSLTHAKPGMLKTSAPSYVLWDFIRKWYFEEGKKMPENDEKAKLILSADPQCQIELFTDPIVEERLKREKKICKFYHNPEPNFGPKAAAKKKKDNKV